MANRSGQSLLLTALVALLVFTAAPKCVGTVVYSQAPDYENLWASQNDIGGYGSYATVYDNFSLSSFTEISAVEWVGGYFNPPSAGTITGWTVTFWSDSAGQPGSQLTSFVLAGNGGETFLQKHDLGDPIYSYHAPVSFDAAAAVMYWLSVVPDLAFSPQWGWTTSSQGDGLSYQDFNGSRFQDPNDQAFSLSATNVPDAGTFQLLGTGVLIIATALRSKLRRYAR